MAVHFWDTAKTVRDLKEDRVTSPEKMKYFLFSLIFLNLPLGRYLLPGVRWGGLSLVIFPIGVAIIIAGIRHCYEVNQNGDNRDFVDRFFCLSLPIGVKIGIVIVSLILVGRLVLFISGTQSQNQNIILMEVILAGITSQIIYFRRIAAHLRRVSGQSEHTTETVPTLS